MKLLNIGSVLLILAQAAPVLAADAEPPKPSPEIQKLGYYLGTWRGEGESKGGPFGPAGKLSSTTTCEWFTGAFHLVCKGEESGPTGTRKFLNIRSYDEAAKSYTEYGISSLGDSEYATGGSIVGNKKTFIQTMEVEGKALKLRYTEVRVSPTLFTYLAEASMDAGPWTVIAEGKVTKLK
ncbi:MAG: DUF1579 family protein [Alphaproteobacteria bacterium]